MVMGKGDKRDGTYLDLWEWRLIHYLFWCNRGWLRASHTNICVQLYISIID
jgi:hypothetical protein